MAHVRVSERMEHLHVLVNGHRIHFIASGQGEPLVLLHGLGAWADLWAPVISELERHYLVVAPDILGFGRSEAPRMRYTRDLLVRWLAGFMDVIGCHAAHIAGNSMGGAIAADFAWRLPERVKKLILIDPAGCGKECGISVKLGAMRVVGPLLGYPWKANQRRAWRHLMGDPNWVTEEFVDYVTTYRQQNTVMAPYLSVLREHVDWSGIKQTLEDRLEGIKSPTLLVWGDKDRLFPVAQGEAAAKRIPHCAFHVMQGCGHVPQMERPKEFAEMVLEFLGRNDQTRIERRARPAEAGPPQPAPEEGAAPPSGNPPPAAAPLSAAPPDGQAGSPNTSAVNQ